MKTRNEHAAPSRADRACPLCNRWGLGGIGVVVLVFGLLLWARFLLVTGHPRTAVAEPPALPAGSATANAGEPR